MKALKHPRSLTLFCSALPLLAALSGLPQLACGEDPGFSEVEKVTLIGVLSEQAYPVCQGGKSVWDDIHPEVGFVRIYPTRPMPADLYGKAVMVHGWKNPGLSASEPIAFGSCGAEMQLRSDWVPSRDGGFRILREVAPAVREIGPMAAESITPFEGLSFKRVGEQLEAGFRNPLGQNLGKFELRAHYEGCYGKPSTHHRSHTLVSLAPGAEARASFPTLLSLPFGASGSELYLLHSVQVLSETQDVLFDYDQPLRKAGLKLSCPEP